MARIVVYDACVLYPAPLRDLLMHLAVLDLVHARWTEMIQDEWVRSVLADRPDLKPEQLARTRALMNAYARDALVEGFEPLIAGLTLPDPDDRHVLAAAIHAGAEVIVTFNLADFPDAVLAPHGQRAQHPDEFVCELIDASPRLVCTAARRQRESLKRPPCTVDEYLDTLARVGLPRAAAALKGTGGQL